MSSSTVNKPGSRVSQVADTRALQHQARLAWLRAFYWLDRLPGDGAVLEYARARMKAEGLYPASMSAIHIVEDLLALVAELRA